MKINQVPSNDDQSCSDQNASVCERDVYYGTVKLIVVAQVQKRIQ